MTQHGLRQTFPLLAASLSLLLVGIAAASERPRPENFPDYGQFVKASVDYERAQTSAAQAVGRKAKDRSALCQDSTDKGRSKTRNSCEGKYLIIGDTLPDSDSQTTEGEEGFVLSDSPPPPESLDEAVINAGAGSLAAANTDALRNNSTGMTLQEISADEMANAGIGGLLGLVNNVRMQNLGSSASPLGAWGLAAGGSGGSGSATSDPDGSVRVSLDDVALALDSLNLELFGSLVNFDNGYAIINSKTSVSPSGGLLLELSSEAYTGLNAVDRDGMPGTEWAGAGAITVDQMAVFIPYLKVDIQSASTDFERDGSLLSIDAYSPGEITVQMANSLIGVAPASVDGSYIGPSTPIIAFGPDGGITIGSGTRVNVLLAQPDGLRTAFVTLNGRVGDISVRDIRLLDTIGGGALRVGRINVRNINLVDSRIFIVDRSVAVDLGRGLDNVEIDMERVYLGSDAAGGFIGDFYARGARINEVRLTIAPH